MPRELKSEKSQYSLKASFPNRLLWPGAYAAKVFLFVQQINYLLYLQVQIPLSLDLIYVFNNICGQV